MIRGHLHRPAWAARPAVVIASGPSLSVEQLLLVAQARDALKVHAIAVNNTVERATFADVCYFGDYTAIKHYLPKLRAKSRAEWVTIDKSAAERWKLTHVRPASQLGMSLDRIHVNGNSGLQAINLAAAFGARRVILLGFDMQAGPNGEKHWFGDHPGQLVPTMLFDEWIHKALFVAQDAKDLDIDIVNCTPGSALQCFRMGNLEDELR